jgi:hypothetical protein
VDARETVRCSIPDCRVTAVGEYGVFFGEWTAVLPYCAGHELDALDEAARRFARKSHAMRASSLAP